MNTKIKDNCPSCNIPWTEHLGIQGICKELQQAKAQVKLACRDWAEDDTAVRKIAEEFGLDTKGDSYFVPCMLDLVDQIAGIARDSKAELQQAREALKADLKFLKRLGYNSEVDRVAKALSPQPPTQEDKSPAHKLALNIFQQLKKED